MTAATTAAKTTSSADGDVHVGNVVALVRRHAAAAPDRRALVEVDAAGRPTRTTTYGALRARLDATAAALTAHGVGPGDRVAVFVSGGTDFVAVVYALFQAGAVPVLIDPGMGAANVLACVREQRPTALVGVAKAHVLRALARRAFASVRRAFLVGGRFFPGAIALDALVATAAAGRGDEAGAAGARPGAGTYGDDAAPATKRGGDDAAFVHAPAPGATAAVLYTSGSTGPPKGVLYTHAMLGGQATAIAAMFAAEGAPIVPGDVDVACFLPFALFDVALGMTAVFPAMDFRKPAAAAPAAIRAALVEQRATSAFASPALWEPFSRAAVDAGWTFPGLRRVLTAGAPVRPALHERLLRALPDGDVYTPYGATEALPVAVIGGRRVLSATAARTRAGAGTCVGRVAPGTEVRVVAVVDGPIATIDDATPAPRGAIGEIIVRGGVVTQAYDARDEANHLSKIVDRDAKWHRMGDLGYLDDDGMLWFCGRKTQRVETAAGLLTSVPVEAVYETHAAVARAALVGLGEKGAQTPVVVVELAAGAQPSAALAAEILARGAAHAHTSSIDRVLFHPKFPVDRRHNAKIEREALAKWAASLPPAAFHVRRVGDAPAAPAASNGADRERVA